MFAKTAAAQRVLDETYAMPWRKLRLLTSCERRKGRRQAPRSSIVNLGVFSMSRLRRTLAAAALSLSTLIPAGFASAADLPVKAKAKPVADLPFFLVIDDRVSFSWMPKGTDPGMFTVNPNGSINGTTPKQVYSFTHFDAWAYGTNFFTISMFKSGHNDPANPCTNAGVVFNPGTGVATAANCEGATEIYGLFRST